MVVGRSSRPERNNERNGVRPIPPAIQNCRAAAGFPRKVPNPTLNPRERAGLNGLDMARAVAQRLDRNAESIVPVDRANGEWVELAAALEKLGGLKGYESELARLHLDRLAEWRQADLDGVGSDVRHRPNDIGIRPHAPILANEAPGEQGKNSRREEARRVRRCPINGDGSIRPARLRRAQHAQGGGCDRKDVR